METFIKPGKKEQMKRRVRKARPIKRDGRGKRRRFLNKNKGKILNFKKRKT